MIITGANVPPSSFEEAPFWDELKEVLAFAKSQVTSTLCACLASHAAVYEFYGLEREPLAEKRWGVFSHRLQSLTHPLVRNINTRFDVPHSRLNDISAESMLSKGLHLLVGSEVAGVHLAVSPDGFRFVYFQGHPEYDRISLLKEYKREIGRFLEHAREDYPSLPDGYFDLRGQELLNAFQHHVLAGPRNIVALEGFPEETILSQIDNAWGDTAKSVFNNWLGMTYQITNQDRSKPLMEGVDPSNPIGFLDSSRY